MSTGSNKDDFDVRSVPFRNIGCNDLMRVGYTKSGFLRKKGKIERMIEKRISINWRQRYVILSEGCIYVYANELSKSPIQGFSLVAYKSVVRAQHQSMHNVFELRPKDREKRPHIFSCESDDTRLEWMRSIFEFIMLANHQYPPSDIKSYQYEDIDGVDPIGKKPLVGRKPSDRKLPNIPPPKVPEPDGQKERKSTSEYDFESEEEEEGEEYSYVEEKIPMPTVKSKAKQFGTALPGLTTRSDPPKTESVKSPKKPLPSPTSASPTSPMLRKPSGNYKEVEVQSVYYNDDDATEYMLDSSDRDEAQRLLNGKLLGTFLIRNSRKDPSEKVLSYKCDEGVKEMKLSIQGSKVSLFQPNKDEGKRDIFDSLAEMLNFYKQNALPTRDLTLLHGYNKKT